MVFSVHHGGIMTCMRRQSNAIMKSISINENPLEGWLERLKSKFTKEECFILRKEFFDLENISLPVLDENLKNTFLELTASQKQYIMQMPNVVAVFHYTKQMLEITQNT